MKGKKYAEDLLAVIICDNTLECIHTYIVVKDSNTSLISIFVIDTIRAFNYRTKLLLQSGTREDIFDPLERSA